ncbi:MAG: hypothetical protein KGS72_04760 [Cyanobacteria bacterium REEB67]|nr:hypothetical protein [Cyanobacteria bacterium REEB67]
MSKSTASFLNLLLTFFLTVCLGDPTPAVAAPPGGNSPNASPQAGMPPPGDIPAIWLRQTNVFLGNYTVTISNDGICLKSIDRLGFTLVSHAPDWVVNVYRTDDKVFHSQPFKAFSQSGLSSDIITKRFDRVIDGLPTRSRLGKLDCTRVVGYEQILEFLPLGKRAPQIETIIFSAVKTPTNGGIPLYYGRHSKGKDWMTGLKEDAHKDIIKTFEAKEVRVSPKTFALPSGYKRVKSIQEALCSQENRAGADDFKEMFDIGKDKRGATK